MGHVSLKKFFPLFVSIVLVFALIISLALPAFAATTTYKWADWSVSRGNPAWRYQYYIFGTSSSTKALNISSFTVTEVDGYTGIRVNQSNLSNPYANTEYITGQFVFDMSSDPLSFTAADTVYYELRFDMVSPPNMKPDPSSTGNDVIFENEDNANAVKTSPYITIQSGEYNGLPVYTCRSVIVVDSTVSWDTCTLNAAVVSEPIEDLSSSSLQYYIGDLEVEEVSDNEYNDFVMASLGSVLGQLNISNSHLSTLCELVTENNASLSEIIELLNTLSETSTSIDNKLDEVLGYLETLASADASNNDKLTALTNLTATIQTTLTDEDPTNTTVNEQGSQKAEEISQNINQYGEAVDSIDRPDSSDIEMDFGTITDNQYSQGFVDSTLAVLYDNRYIGYTLFMVFAYSILGFILFGKKA